MIGENKLNIIFRTAAWGRKPVDKNSKEYMQNKHRHTENKKYFNPTRIREILDGLKTGNRFELKGFFNQTKKLLVKIFGYIVLLLVFTLLLKGTLEAFFNDSYMKWVTLGITVAALLTTVFMVVRKKSGWFMLKVPVLAVVLLVVYSAILYPTADPKGFTLLQRPTEALLNPIFLIVILAVITGLWIKKQLAQWLRTVITILLIYCASAFVYGMIVGIGLEESFLGTDFFGYIPYFFLQPTYITIQVVFPTIFILAIIVWMNQRKVHSGAAKLFFALAVLVLITEIIGFAAMYRNRVPNVFSLILPSRVGVGEATTTFVDSSGTMVTTRVITKNFEIERDNEAANFYSMALSYIPPSKTLKLNDEKNDEIYKINLSVKDLAGKDVLFLTSKDFDIYQYNVIQEKYDLDFELGGIRTGQNVILILDHSGSMSTVLDQLKLAAKSFVDLKSHRDSILLIPFGNKPEPQPLSKDNQVLKDQIDNIPNGGGTGLYTAILEGYRLGVQLSGPTTMVVMTDGEATDAKKPNQEALADRLKTGKIRIYSVGLGTEKSLDEDFLKNIAKKGGGKYFRTEDAGNLKNIYQTIGAELQSKYTITYQPQIPHPQVHIEAPENGSFVISKTELVVKIPNAKQALVSKINFYIDDSMVAVAKKGATVDTSYSFTLDPHKLTPGKHKLKVVASADKGYQGEDEIEIQVQPAAELKIIAPHAQDHVGKTVEVAADLIIRTNKLLSEVRFAVDGRPIGAAKSSPYAVSWNTRQYGAGEHEILAQAIFTDETIIQDTIKVIVTKEMSIQFKSPINLQELSGSIPLAIEISNENPSDPLVEVNYSLKEEKELGQVNKTPFALMIDTSSFSPGTYVFRATAKTQSGKIANTIVSAVVSKGTLVVDRKGASERLKEARFFFTPKNIAIILDASNSMWGQLPEGPKIDIAKQVLAKIIGMIPQGTNVAFRVYGDQSFVKHRNCKDTQLLMPLSPLNQQKILAKIRNITPRGKTPIAYSISQAPLDLAGAIGSSVVLLITDGIESCEGDPAEAAAKLFKSGIKTKLHVIGYDVGNEEHKANLAKIAQAGGGMFFSAGSGVELTDAIVQAATVDYNILNTKGEIVLKDTVGSKMHELKIGDYRLEVDMEPQLVLEDLQILKNQKTEVLLLQQGDSFKIAVQ